MSYIYYPNLLAATNYKIVEFAKVVPEIANAREQAENRLRRIFLTQVDRLFQKLYVPDLNWTEDVKLEVLSSRGQILTAMALSEKSLNPQSDILCASEILMNMIVKIDLMELGLKGNNAQPQNERNQFANQISINNLTYNGIMSYGINNFSNNDLSVFRFYEYNRQWVTNLLKMLDVDRIKHLNPAYVQEHFNLIDPIFYRHLSKEQVKINNLKYNELKSYGLNNFSNDDLYEFRFDGFSRQCMTNLLEQLDERRFQYLNPKYVRNHMNLIDSKFHRYLFQGQEPSINCNKNHKRERETDNSYQKRPKYNEFADESNSFHRQSFTPNEFNAPVNQTMKIFDQVKLAKFYATRMDVRTFLISNENNKSEKKEYEKLKEIIKSEGSIFDPEVIFHKDGVCVENIKKRYNELRLLVHPDKNLDRVKEATLLFNLLEDAYALFD